MLELYGSASELRFVGGYIVDKNKASFKELSFYSFHICQGTRPVDR